MSETISPPSAEPGAAVVSPRRRVSPVEVHGLSAFFSRVNSGRSGWLSVISTLLMPVIWLREAS
jgi:hypothetical protein